jgi:hypothetical protein
MLDALDCASRNLVWRQSISKDAMSSLVWFCTSKAYAITGHSNVGKCPDIYGILTRIRTHWNRVDDVHEVEENSHNLTGYESARPAVNISTIEEHTYSVSQKS